MTDRQNRSGTRTDVGDLIVMVDGHRYAGRRGRVLGRVSIAAGGAGHRDAFEVTLFPVARSAARLIRCYPSSTELIERAAGL